MKVLILETAAEAAARTAGIISDCLAALDRPVLGLATGGTMEPVYTALVELHRNGKADFSNATTFNLDEYVGLSPNQRGSYSRFMQDALFSRVNLDPARCHLPRGNAEDPIAEAKRYEDAIAAAGGIDLQLLGIGRNGHIGFNEPISSLSGRTRVKTLTESTRRANARYFPSANAIPRYAITMGIGTILDARHCLLLATGGGKSAAVARMIEGPVAAYCPASALQMHPQATVVLDRDAAADLRLIHYYQEIHPGGREPKIP